MRLVVSDGPAAGRVLEVERRLMVGREEGCDLVLEDEKVSRRHCAFSPNPDGTVTLEDLGSSNGTFVRGERISSPVVLRGGEQVRVGSTLLRLEGERAAQATVVGAPATVAAGSMPPAAARTAPPLPGGERPWWRSRRAAIGGIVALLAIGGIVGGLLAASGSGGDEPVALVSTDESPEEETAAATEPAETVPPPETGIVETGVVDAGQLTPQQLELLAFVPEPLQAACQAYEPADQELLTGRVAGLYCPTADGIALFYDSYDSKASMDAAYGFGVGSIERDQGDCSAAFPAEGTYSIGSVPGGRVVCFVAADPAAPVMWWTTDGINVLASATWEGRSERELFDWWASEPGPTP